ncbi:MAG: GYDIA family GHMP kinase [Bacteroidota bacterium]|nr:GYDIA family GHMP kinase [Bacteroidota bacterium]
MSFQSTYHANGKLLLTGEYLVLHGAKAIALPLKVGQQLSVSEENYSDSIHWQAFYDGQVWFSCKLNPTDFSVMNTSHPEKAETLSQIFQTIRTLNPAFRHNAGTKFETTLDANPEWGFGSSSTLISLLSQWAGVDPFALNELVFRGSGFDIACATADGPILYTRNNPVQPISLDYPFSDQLFLVYSGKKKKTAGEVESFLKEKKVSNQMIGEFSALADEFAGCRNLYEFNKLVHFHEQQVGKLIGKSPVKAVRFSDFEGEIKSLGAWGGDFYLISTELPFTEMKKYFENKGMDTVFRWDDLILKRQLA